MWFYGIWNFWRKGRGSSNFLKIQAVILGLYTNILYRSRNFAIEFGQNRLKRSNFFRFLIFWEFFQNCLTQANFDLWSWNFVCKCTNTRVSFLVNDGTRPLVMSRKERNEWKINTGYTKKKIWKKEKYPSKKFSCFTCSLSFR